MLNKVVHKVTTVLQRVKILRLLPSELPQYVVWYAATIVGDPDVSVFCPENGGTRFLGMFVTTYQTTCNTQKTTVLTFTTCKTLINFLGVCVKIQCFRDYLPAH